MKKYPEWSINLVVFLVCFTCLQVLPLLPLRVVCVIASAAIGIAVGFIMDALSKNI